MAKAADRKDPQAMRTHLPAITSAMQNWTLAVSKWKGRAWADVLGTPSDALKGAA